CRVQNTYAEGLGLSPVSKWEFLYHPAGASFSPTSHEYPAGTVMSQVPSAIVHSHAPPDGFPDLGCASYTAPSGSGSTCELAARTPPACTVIVAGFGTLTSCLTVQSSQLPRQPGSAVLVIRAPSGASLSTMTSKEVDSVPGVKQIGNHGEHSGISGTSQVNVSD